MKNVINVEENGEHEKIATRIEKDKANFGRKEIQGKTIVIGLGAIRESVRFFYNYATLFLFFFLFLASTNGSDEISIRCLTF